MISVLNSYAPEVVRSGESRERGVGKGRKHSLFFLLPFIVKG